MNFNYEVNQEGGAEPRLIKGLGVTEIFAVITPGCMMYFTLLQLSVFW